MRLRSTEIKRATRGFSFVFRNQVMYIQTTYYIGTQEKIRSGVDIYLPGHIDNVAERPDYQSWQGLESLGL